MNAFTAILAREHPGLLINCCCPGWVSTDMGRSSGFTPPKSAGKLIVERANTMSLLLTTR